MAYYKRKKKIGMRYGRRTKKKTRRSYGRTYKKRRTY